MDYFFIGILFIFGTIVGSFLNVVILRYNTGVGLTGRSGCFSCGHTLSWYELIPIISYVALGGRCRMCKSRISIQYPLVELTTGLLFAGLYAKGYVGFDIFIPLVVISLLVVIFVYDLHHKIIPNALVYAFSSLAFFQLFLQTNPFSFIVPNVLNILAGPLVALPFFLLWLLSHGRWMGLGDGKLVLGFGWILGLLPGLSAIMYGFWIGAIVSVALIALAKLSTQKGLLILRTSFTMKSEIPFAPFLIIGFLIVFFTGLDIVALLY